MKYQRVTTHLAETMSKLDVDKAMRDDYAKCILADPQILANIVKVIVQNSGIQHKRHNSLHRRDNSITYSSGKAVH